MKYGLRTFKDIIDAVCEQLKIQSTDVESRRRIKRNINTVLLDEVLPFSRWVWLRKNRTAQSEPYYGAGTANVEQNSTEVTLSNAPGTSKKGFYFSSFGGTTVYKVATHAAGSTSLTLETPFIEATNAAVSFRIWFDEVPLPTDCKEVIEVTGDYMPRPLQNYGLQEIRRLVAAQSKQEGRPACYTVSNYNDPAPYAAIAGLPAVVSRSSDGLVKTIIFASDLAAYITAGDNLQVEGSGDYTYNVNAVADVVNGSTLTYTGTVMLTEATTADPFIVVEKLRTGSFQDYKALVIAPSLSNARSILHIDYQVNVEELNADTDEPPMPVEDRVVLYYGAMAMSCDRERNPEWASKNEQLFGAKLARMAGKTGDQPEKPILQASNIYLRTKRIGGSSKGLAGTDPFYGVGGIGTGSSNPTGTPNTLAFFNSDGDLVGTNDIPEGVLEADEISYNNSGTSISADNVQDAITEVSSDVTAAMAAAAAAQADADFAQGSIDAHIADTSDAHDASAISNIPAGNIVATDVQAALNELDSDLTAHISDATDAHAASAITNTPAGGISATNVQTALNELDTEKANLASPTFTGVPAAPTATGGTNTTQIATTAFVQAALGSSVSSVFGRTGAVVAVSGDYTGTQVTNTPAGGIAAVTVQAAIDELDTEKSNLASPTFTGTPAAPTASGGTNTTQIATTAFVTSAVSTAGATYQPLDSTLTSLAAYNTNGLLTQTAADTFTGRTITGTASEIAVTNGNGVSGNPTIGLASSPALAGVPTAATAATTTNTTQIATTAFVQQEILAQNTTLAKTANYTAATTDHIITCDSSGGAFTITLFASSGNSKRELIIKKTDSSFNTVTIDANSTETIDGALTKKLATQWECLTIVCDGSNWIIKNRRIDETTKSFTPTISGLGTVTSLAGFWQRIGDRILVYGYFTGGTAAASNISVSLPSGLNYSTTLTGGDTNAAEAGMMYRENTGSTYPATNSGGWPMFLDGANLDQVYVANTGSGTAFAKTNGSTIFNNTERASYRFTIPITNWEG